MRFFTQEQSNVDRAEHSNAAPGHQRIIAPHALTPTPSLSGLRGELGLPCAPPPPSSPLPALSAAHSPMACIRRVVGHRHRTQLSKLSPTRRASAQRRCACRIRTCGAPPSTQLALDRSTLDGNEPQRPASRRLGGPAAPCGVPTVSLLGLTTRTQDSLGHAPVAAGSTSM
jgi:hypothetical protein